MKNLILIATLLITTTTFAKPTRLETIVDTLGAISQGGVQSFKTKPADAKSMLEAIALNDGLVESHEDFAEHWTDEAGEAWEADTSLWSEDTIQGAHSYVHYALKDHYEYSGGGKEGKVELEKSLAVAKKAFTELKTMNSVSYGVVPMGAVQCGVSFPALMIMDTKTGEAHLLVMEGSGC